MRPTYLWHGDPYTAKMTSLYWDAPQAQGSLLITWINFNSSMNQSLQSVGWNDLSIPKLKQSIGVYLSCYMQTGLCHHNACWCLAAKSRQDISNHHADSPMPKLWQSHIQRHRYHVWNVQEKSVNEKLICFFLFMAVLVIMPSHQ